jgi:hypothetical protein
MRIGSDFKGLGLIYPTNSRLQELRYKIKCTGVYCSTPICTWSLFEPRAPVQLLCDLVIQY